MADKFKQFQKMCQEMKDGKTQAKTLITQDLSILGDTLEELQGNLDLFFQSGGLKIQTADGMSIEMYLPRTII